jgi:ferrous iron transport protein A
MMRLNIAPEGQFLTLISISGGLGVQKHLNALGLTPGTEVMIVSQNRDGPIILAVKDSRLAIGRGLLHHIQVEVKESLTHQTESHDSPVLTFRHVKNGKHRYFRY